MHLRPATRSDVELLRRWGEKLQVVDSREQLIAEQGGRPIGFVQITDPAREGSCCWGAIPEGRRAIDIWIGDEADLGKGHGTTIMRLVIDLCFADPGVLALLVDPPVSNERAHRFYERLGFRFVVRRRFGADDCCVYRLTRREYQGSELSRQSSAWA